MALTLDAQTMTASRQRRSFGHDLLAVVVIAALAGLGFLLFPDNLALLTRLIAIALLVLSLDLVVGYCGIATLDHAALFGAGAYAAGIASAHFGITDPLLMTLAGMVGGAVAGLVCGIVILRAQ